MTNRHWWIGAAVAVIIGALAASAPAVLTINPTPFYTHSQTGDLFSMRGLALAKDLSGDVYYGHIQGADDGVLSTGDRHIVRLSGTPAILNTTVFSIQPKALETDGRGNVYAGGYQNGQPGVYIYDRTLTTSSFFPVAQADEIDGLAARTVNNTVFLYVSNRNDWNAGKSFVRQYDVTNVAAPAATGWERTLATTGLRGIAVNSATGEVWATARTTFITYDSVNPNQIASINPGGGVFKISADASSATSISQPDAVDVVIRSGNAYVVTQPGLLDKNGNLVVNGTTSQILELNSALAVTQSYALNIVNPSSSYGLGQIDVNAFGLFYITDEDSSIGGLPTTYVDRIYTAHLPEPGSLVLLGVGGAVVLMRRRRGV